MDRHFRASPFRPAAVALIVALAGCAAATRPTPDQTISDDTRARLARVLEASGDTAGAAAVLHGPADGEGAPDPLTHATALVAAGQVDKGMQEAKIALATHGDDLAFALEVGRLALRAGRLTDAGDVYRQILLRHPDSVEALNGNGVVLAQQGDLAGAADTLRQALASHPQDVPTRNNLALVLALSGHNDLALSMLEDLARTGGSPHVKATLALARDGLRANDAAPPSPGRPLQ